MGTCPVNQPDPLHYSPAEEPALSNPGPLYARLREHGPIYNEELGGYLISRYSSIVWIANHPEIFAASWSNPIVFEQPKPIQEVLQTGFGMGPSVVTSDPPLHAQRKQIWRYLVHGSTINKLVPRMHEIAREIIDDRYPDGKADAVANLAQPFVEEVIGELLGLPEEDRKWVYDRVQDTIKYATPFLSMDERVDAARRHVETDYYLSNLLEQRRHDPRDDIISTLATVSEFPETPMSTPDYLMTVRTFYGAGVDTTRDAITSTMLSMLTYRQYWDQAINDQSSITSMIDETLRRDAPQRGLLRMALQDITIDGTYIPAGSQVVLLYGSGNLDEEIFQNPDQFIPGRPDVRKNHLGFGSGGHQCVASHLGRKESEVFLREILQKMPSMELDQRYQYRYKPSIFFRGLEYEPVTWIVD